MGAEARIAVRLLIVILVATLSAAPLWSQDGGGVPTAIGFITSDGETGVTHSVATADSQTELSLQLSAAPDAPVGHLLVYLINLARANSGLPPLKVASELMEAAQAHSDWMAEHDCFAHTCPGEANETTRIEGAGYLYWTYLAENLAANQTTPGEVVTAWMNSPGHRGNMLSTNFREAGGGYASSDDAYYQYYWTADFGARNDSEEEPVYPVYPVVINKEAWSTSSLDVSLYVYGSHWPAQQMRFRNEGGSWSEWEPFCAEKSWTLSCSQGSPASVYAQITDGDVVLESNDEIFVDIPLSVEPSLLVFLSEQGSTTVPESYQLEITCCDQWTATPSQNWIKLTETAGIGTAETTVYLQGQSTTPGYYSGTITIQTEGSQTEVQVTLVVTDDPLEHGYVPLVAKNRQ